MTADYQLEDTLYIPFTTRAFATGIPTVLAGSPVVDIYRDDTTLIAITAETLTVSAGAGGIAGFNLITITATAATGFVAGETYHCILSAGTVDGVSVVGEVVATFTLQMSAAAKAVGAIADSAAAGDPSTTESVMQYVKQTVNLLAGADGIGTNPSGTAPANAVNMFEILNDIHDVLYADSVGASLAVDMATQQTDLDTITGTSGVLIGTDAANVTEISDAVWDEDATGHQGAGIFGQAIGDPGANAETMYDAVVTDATGTNVATDCAAVLADTGTDGVIIATAGFPADGYAAGAITAASIAANAIGASELAADAVNKIWDDVLEAEGSITAHQALTICLAVLAGVTASDGAVIKTPDGVATRVTATVDGDQQRTGMVLNHSAHP